MAKLSRLTCILVILVLTSTGCSQEKLKETFGKLSGKDDTKSVAEQLQEQGVLDANGNAVGSQEEAAEVIILTAEEMEALHLRIIEFHTLEDKKVEDFEEFRVDFQLYATNIINSRDAESKLTELQSKLDDSKFRLYDTDGDGISDFLEMCVTDTSPLRKSTHGEKLDGQTRYPSTMLVFVDNGGTVRTIYPELAPLVLQSIENGVIRPLDGQYTVVDLMVLGNELDSLRIITEGNPTVTEQLKKVAYVYPITVRISGPAGSSISGEMIFMHKNYASLTQEKSVIFLYSPYGQSATVDLLTRTPTSTSTPTSGKVYIDKTYNLLFPAKSGVQISTIVAR